MLLSGLKPHNTWEWDLLHHGMGYTTPWGWDTSPIILYSTSPVIQSIEHGLGGLMASFA